MSQVVVDGLMTDYVSAGKGKVVLLLHGWGDDHTTFNDLQKSLSKNFQVVSLDLPGFGKTQAPASIWGLDDYSGFISNFANKIGLKIYALVGHSNGGAIAIRGIANKQLTTEKLILLASSGIRGEYKGRNKALRLVTKTGKFLVKPLPGRIQKKLRAKLYKSVGSDMLVAEHLQETFKKVVTDDVRLDAPKIGCKSLLIYGNQDTATPLKYAEMLDSKIPYSTLHIIKDAGHFVHHDASEQVQGYIEEFLV